MIDDDARAWLSGEMSSEAYFAQAWEREWAEARREIRARLRRPSLWQMLTTGFASLTLRPRVGAQQRGSDGGTPTTANGTN